MTGQRITARGFSILEMALLILLIGMLLVFAFATMPRLDERTRLDRTAVLLGDVSDALLGFAAVNGRLPCPDTSPVPNGLEGSGAVSGCTAGDISGLVPYREIGLADEVRDRSHIPVRYAVYRNATAEADLATLPNRFVPVLPGDPPTLTTYTGLPDDPAVVTPPLGINKVRLQPDQRNDLDFCLALRNARAAAPDVAFVHTLDPPGIANVAFVLASAGVSDADGDGVDGAFDGAQEGAGGITFESPDRRRDTTYDDLVLAMPLGELDSRMACTTVTVATTSSANISIAASHALAQAEDSVWAAELGVTSAEVAVASSAIAVVMGAITIWAAANDLALASAGCVAALADICAALPFAIAGLTLSIIAEVAAVATVVIAALSLVEANKALVAAEDTIPGVYAHALKTLQDALDADARGGQL